MKTFILLTFGFLAFAFYEMSGGSEFEPASAQMATVQVAVPQPKQITGDVTAPPARIAPAPVMTSTKAPVAKITNAPDITRVALDLRNAAEAQKTAEPRVAAVSTQTETPSARINARITNSMDTPQIILPSLIATPDTYGIEAAADVRTVSGNRVNVRDGPSTNYGIVSKLSRGAEVRILEDNGDGWVLMQPVDGGEVGWMADFLLTSG